MANKMITDQARKYMNPNEVDVIIYHKFCQDGTTAAACGYRYSKTVFKKQEFIPLKNGQVLDDYEVIRNKNVLVVDFSFDKEELEKCKKFAKKIMVLDHHDSAMKELDGVDGTFFDMEESGASLAWYYFFPDEACPNFIKFVKDRDIWKWEYEEFSRPMYYSARKLRKLYEFVPYLESNDLTNELVIEGQEIMKNDAKYIKESVKNACFNTVSISGNDYKIVVLELDGPKLVSEIAENLYTNNDIDFTVCWFRDKESSNKFFDKLFDRNQKYVLSLRTNKEHINVGQIAKQISPSGGGHVKAAGSQLIKYPYFLYGNGYSKYLNLLHFTSLFFLR